MILNGPCPAPQPSPFYVPVRGGYRPVASEEADRTLLLGPGVTPCASCWADGITRLLIAGKPGGYTAFTDGDLYSSLLDITFPGSE